MSLAEFMGHDAEEDDRPSDNNCIVAEQIHPDAIGQDNSTFAQGYNQESVVDMPVDSTSRPRFDI